MCRSGSGSIGGVQRMNEIPIGGIQSLDELLDSEVVRSEFLSPTFQAKVTIQYARFRFNAACVRMFSDTQFVQVLVDRSRKRIVVIPCQEFSPCRLKWSNYKDGKPQSRDCLAKFTCAKLFEMMNWIPENRYKIMAVYQELEGVRLIVFNLVECEMVVSETIIRDDGKTVKEINVIRPEDWLKTFGNPYRTHSDAYKVDLSKYYLMPDNLTGEEQESLLAEKKPIIPREPTPREIVLREYGGEEDDNE
jgi:hypothetical protein